MNPEELLAQALELLGLRYDLERRGDLTVAAFRYEVGRDAMLPFDAMVRGGILQLRARVQPAPAPADELLAPINEVNRRWLLGRVYLDEGGWLGAATSVLARQATSLERPTRVAFAHLVHAAILLLRAPECFVGVGDPSFSYANPAIADSFVSRFVEEAEDVPRVGGGDQLEQLAEQLLAIGRPFQAVAGKHQLVQRYAVPGARDRVVDLYLIGDAFLGMRARFLGEVVVVDQRAALQAASRLNARFAIGNAVIEDGRALVLVTLPLAWTRLDAELARWLVDRAHAALDAVEREIPLRSTT